MDENDIFLDAGQGMFNYRAGAIIIRNNSVLMVRGESSPYYYSVGGHVKFGETAAEAVIREVYEETGVHAEIDRLGFVHENFFRTSGLNKGAVYHELALFYYIKPSADFDDIPVKFSDGDRVQRLKWIDLDDIKNVYLYPEFFKTELKHPSREVKTIVVNEL